MEERQYSSTEEQILKDLLTIQQSYGLDIGWLDGDDLLDVVPDLNRDGLIGGTFVTQSFDDADDLDDDDFATGKGLRLAVGRSIGKRLRLEGALLALEADGGALPSGVDIEATSTQLHLTWDIR